jgi:hypothetical protein
MRPRTVLLPLVSIRFRRRTTFRHLNERSIHAGMKGAVVPSTASEPNPPKEPP